jgi:hypothetical protein
MAFCAGSCFRGQQSCLLSVEADTSEMSADFGWTTAAPPEVGSKATDNAIKKIRMVRPMFMARAARPK